MMNYQVHKYLASRVRRGTTSGGRTKVEVAGPALLDDLVVMAVCGYGVLVLSPELLIGCHDEAPPPRPISFIGEHPAPYHTGEDQQAALQGETDESQSLLRKPGFGAVCIGFELEA